LGHISKGIGVSFSSPNSYGPHDATPRRRGDPPRACITAEATVKDAAGRLLAHGLSTLMVLQP
jgi:hypothetical protein